MKMKVRNAKVALISLGCPKNLVDSEYMLGILLKNKWGITPSLEEADVIIINTCAFIESAQQEAVDTILEIAERKDGRKLVVAGCLVSLFKKELLQKMPQIDAIIDPFNIDRIGELFKELDTGSNYIYYLGKRDGGKIEFLERCITRPPYSTYLKIAEGCNNFCSYCIIPYLRGKYRSRRMEEIIGEAEVLAEAGCKEINIVAQDTTLYGLDIYGEKKLPQLLNRLSEIKGIRWIRILYTHPAHYSEQLIDTVSQNEKVCKYLDIPLQHCNDRILRLMRRKVTKKDIFALIENLRERIPHLGLRTTFIVGFPTETREEFNELLDFVHRMEFDHLGAFSYSPQKDIPGIPMKDNLSESIKQKRREELLLLQRSILQKKNRSYLGREITVLVDSKIGHNLFVARTKDDAPEIDRTVRVRGNTRVGDFVKVRITGASWYEFNGEVVGEERMAR